MSSNGCDIGNNDGKSRGNGCRKIAGNNSGNSIGNDNKDCCGDYDERAKGWLRHWPWTGLDADLDLLSLGGSWVDCESNGSVQLPGVSWSKIA